MKLLLLAAILTSSSAFAASSLTLASYLKVQEALAADDFKTSLTSHTALCAQDGKSLSAYKDCSKKFKNIDELRTSFKTLSEIYIKNIPASDLKGATKATCPMAAARWIQKDGDLRNPYYGKSMLECGEKI